MREARQQKPSLELFGLGIKGRRASRRLLFAVLVIKRLLLAREH